MKRLATLLAALLVLSSTAYAQDRYYYSDERRIPIEQSEKWTVVQVPERAQSTLTGALAQNPDIRLRRKLDPERGFYWLEAKGQQALGAATLDWLSQRVPVQRTIPAFFRVQGSDTTRFIMTDEFSVQFKQGVSRAEIKALNEKHGVEFAPLEDAMDERRAREYNVYLLRVTATSPLNALEVANRYYEHPLTKWSLPNFFMNFKLHGEVPEAFALEDGYPNPSQAGQRVTIPFALPEAAEVTLTVYDMLGREVQRIESGTVAAGRPQAVVSTEGFSSGIYVYRLRAVGTSGETFTGTGKLVVVQ